MAAEKQNKSIEYIQRIIETPDFIYEDSFYYEIAKEVNLNERVFSADVEDNSILKDLLLTRDFLFANGIHITPSLIINGKYYESEDLMLHLDRLITDELKKNKK